MSIAAVIVCSVFNSYMRIQELRELSFKTSYLPLGYPTFFYASSCRIGRFRFGCPIKVGIRKCKVFREKYYP